MPKPDAKDLAKEVAVKLAKEAVKKAAMQAAATAATAAAPWIGAGCLIVVGVIVLLVLFATLSFLTIYSICEHTPSVFAWLVTWWNDLPDICAIIIQ